MAGPSATEALRTRKPKSEAGSSVGLEENQPHSDGFHQASKSNQCYVAKSSSANALAVEDGMAPVGSPECVSSLLIQTGGPPTSSLS